MITLRFDSRDLNYHEKFGQATSFPDTLNVDCPLPDDVQPIGDEKCACYMTADLAADETNALYDIDDLYARIPHTATGQTDPRDALGEAVKHGLKYRSAAGFNYSFSSYWTAHTGAYDAFDNIRSALMLANTPVGIWSNWRAEWYGAGQPMMQGGHTTSGHAYDIQGWTQINGKPMLVIQAWQGYTMYMPRETCNEALKDWGASTAVLSTSAIDVKRKKLLIEKIIDACKNAISWLLQLKAQTPPVPLPPNPTPMTHPSIADWANAVKQVEGWTPGSPSQTHNNPGNLGYTTLTASWGGQKGSPKSDGGNFCRFADYDSGFKALCNFLTLGAENQLLKFHQARTLGQFSSVYGNTGLGYGIQIAKILNVPVSTNIANFLT